MKKTSQKLLLTLGLFLTLGGLSVSCSDDKTTTTTPEPKPQPDADGNTYVETKVVTPIRYAVSPYKGDDEGISVNVTTATANQLKFVCEPGKDVNSYRLQVYPIASLYNSLLNTMNTAGESKLTVDQTAGFIQGVVQDASSTAPGVHITKKIEGDDFASKEFDYTNSALKAFDLQPNIDYLIVVQAYFDNDGKTVGDFCIVHAKTAAREIQGSPAIDILVTPSWKTYRVAHVPNDDCTFFYYLAADTKQIQQYIDLYGEDMYRALLCNYGARVTSTEVDALTFLSDIVDPKVSHTATAVALDINGTAVNKLTRKDFKLPEVPDVTEDPACTFATPDKIGAALFYFNATLDKTCKNAYYAVETSIAANALKNGDENAKKARAMELSLYGWGIHNKNFKFDTENKVSIGESFTSREKWDDDILKDGTEYMIIYIGENNYGEISELRFSDPFRLKPRVKTNAAGSKTDVDIKFLRASRTMLHWEVSYTIENTSVFYFQDYRQETGPDAYQFPAEESDADEFRLGPKGWLDYLIDFRDGPLNSRWANMHPSSESTGTAKYEEGVDGYAPATEFRFAYAGEDWDGVVGPVKFFHGSTQTPEGGLNPTIAISAERETGNEYAIKVESNNDSREIMYLCYSINDPEASALSLSDLKKKNPNLTYEDYIEAWTAYTEENGLMTQNTSVTLGVTMNGDFMVAMAFAVGATDKNGNPVVTELATVIVANGVTQSLEQYLGVQKKTVQKKTVQMTTPLAGPWKPTQVARKDTRLRAWEVKNM